MELEYDEYKEEPDKAPGFTFPLRDRFIQEGVGVKLIASLSAKPHPEVGTVVIYTNKLAPSLSETGSYRRVWVSN